jgi:hypothetical protein
MQLKSALIMRILLNRYGKASPEEFFQHLPEEEISQIAQLDIETEELSPLLKSPLALIEKIHYSWLTPLVQKFSAPVQSVLLSALPDEQARRLLHVFQLPHPSSSPAPIIKQYLVHRLLKQLKGIDRVLPLEFLPNSPTRQLVDMTKRELVELLECLGVHDISEELRRIVDKKSLKRVYECLSPKEQAYLRVCMHLKNKIASPRLGLEKWNGDCEKLRNVMQSRGLIRLGKALSGENPDFVWHIAHRLDIGRGQTLRKHYSRQAIPGVTPALYQQVVNLISFLKRKSEP